MYESVRKDQMPPFYAFTGDHSMSTKTEIEKRNFQATFEIIDFVSAKKIYDDVL